MNNPINRLLTRMLIRSLLGMLSWVLGQLWLPLLILLLCFSIVAAIFGGPNTGPTSVNASSGNNTTTQQYTGKKNTAVVNAARMLVQTLYPCGSSPEHYKCYTSAFPANVVQYLDNACGNPNCPYAQNGDLQCVFFVLGAYWLAGQALPYGPNAVEFWATYHSVSGWVEIPADGVPEPGDMIVFSGPLSGPYANPFGHIAIVIDVAFPGSSGTGGYIQLAQGNGLKSVENLPLTQINPGQAHPLYKVTAWDGYGVMGYIRNAANG